MAVHRTASIFCFALILASKATVTQAQEFGATAKVARRITSTHGEDASASGTSLDLEKRVTPPRTLGEVVREAPGARVISTGGLGALSSVSLRGADSDETMVLLGEIPLVTPEGGAFDLSLFPVELFERVDVFRGGAPVWLGSGAIGGVVRLVPRSAERTRASAQVGAGSFSTYQLDADAEVTAPHAPSARSYVLARSTAGDYPYSDDNGTVLSGGTSDDTTRRRRNAELTEAAGFTNVSLPLLGGNLQLLALGVAKTGGFPGPASKPTPSIHRQSSRALFASAYERVRPRRFPKNRTQLLFATSYGRDRYTDLYGQLGISKQTATDDGSLRMFSRGATTLELVRWLEGTLLSSYAFDTYRPDNAFAFPKPAPSDRHTFAGALELAFKGEFGPVRAELRPSARLEWSATEVHATRSLNGAFDARDRVLAPTFRVGTVIEAWRKLAVSGSFATGTRLPSMFELFGDRGLTLPSPALEPVQSMTYDGGLTAREQRGRLACQAELRGFHQRRKNAIVMSRTNQWQAYHENLAEVKQWGLESGLSLSAGYAPYADLHASLTYLKTENPLGNRLALRPQLAAYLRPELRAAFANEIVSGASVATELYHRSFAFVDNANVNYSPACTKLALGGSLELWDERLRVSARFDDLFDVRCNDLLGYPLPGRSMFVTVSFQEPRDDA